MDEALLSRALHRISDGTFDWKDFTSLNRDEEAVFTIQLAKHQSSIDLYSVEMHKAIEALDILPDNEDLNTLIATLKVAIDESQDAIDVLLKDRKETLKLATNASSDTNDNKLKSLEGTRCRILYRGNTSGASSDWHNAIISDVITADDGEVKIKVFFSNPTKRSMQPCPHYLNDKCLFDDRCKFSHGYLCDVDALFDYTAPDFSTLTLEKRCLALDEDSSLWHYSRVVDILEHGYKVTYERDEETVYIVNMSQILPLESDSSSDSDDDDDDDLDYSSFTLEKTVDEFASWESHTKGIGSKLMAKMGYIFGTGLGKSKEGIIDPVQIKVLPPGKTLDYIMNKRTNEEGRCKSRKRKKHLPNKDVFDFINHKMVKKKEADRTVVTKTLTKSISKNDLKKKSARDLHIQIFKTGEEIANAHKKIKSLNVSLERNKGDRIISQQINAKITELNAYIHKLEASDKCIKSHQNTVKGENKLRIF